jgi:hypothetical protein
MVLSLELTLVLTTLGSSIYWNSLHEVRLAEWSRATNQAIWHAEAASDSSLRNLRRGDFGNLPLTPLADGIFWADVAQTAVPLQFRILGHGVAGGAQRDVELVAQLAEESVFQFALFGSQHVELAGDPAIDSYDSGEGAYNPATANENGDVGTNVTTPGGIVIDGSIEINGQVAVGPEAPDPNAVVTINGGSADITGQPPVVSQTDALFMPAVTPPPGMPCQNLTLAGSTELTLSSAVGVYCFRNVSVIGNSRLTADGPVTVYITGDFTMAGNTTVGTPASPGNFLVYSTGTGRIDINGQMGGTTDFYGGIYGPRATIELSGDAEVFGSVVTQQVGVNGNAQIHYDEALSVVDGPTGLYRVRVLSWREL